MNPESSAIVFTPDNEPYLGRSLLLHLDEIIISALDQNAKTAPRSHALVLTDHQQMACQVIAQALSIMLSVRELIRQGYLFGGQVLVRPFVERAAILLYLHLHPEDIRLWNEGWSSRRGAPSLSTMLDKIADKLELTSTIGSGKLLSALNSLLHSKPDSAPWNVIMAERNGLAHAVSKILDRPELCDSLCADMIPWIGIIQAMMASYFP